MFLLLIIRTQKVAFISWTQDDLSFSGDFIGPLLTDDHIMVNKKEGLINIDCTTWCLPGDGVTVAIFEKENADC